jgi:DNA-binding NarL/FixJ family response regulator
MPDPAATTLTVLVVDDHEIVRQGVRHLLGARADVIEASDLQQANAQLAAAAVDLLLLDLSLGADFGLAALPRLRADHPALKIIVLSSLSEALYAERALAAGADGYVAKTALGQTLLEAIDTVVAGRMHASPALQQALLSRAAGRTGANGRAELSPRELEVLRHVAGGLGTREIAERLNRSVKTIETHKQALKGKLGADTPAQLMRIALDWFGETP